MKKICIYSSSSNNVDESYFKEAQKLADVMFKNNLGLVYGGAKVGPMFAIAKRMQELGSKITGVMPQFLVDIEKCHKGCDELIITKTMRERKAIMEERADAFIALAGGLGTLEETFEMITTKELHLHNKPIVFLNTNQYFTPLFEIFEKYYEKGFLRDGYRETFFIANTPEEAIEYVLKETQKQENVLQKL